jgi:hypothetical protein
MSLGAWMTCCWPGLPRLWWRGQWSGFLVAAVFSLWLNAALAVTFLTPDFIGAQTRVANWTVLAVVWVFCVLRGARRVSLIYCGDGRHNDELFSRAQVEYLRGQWFEAESLLLRLLRDDPADLEGRLLLATLYRHTRRPDLAGTQLEQIERYPHGARWRWEILQERNRLEAVEHDAPPAGGTENEHSADDEDQQIAVNGALAESGGLSKAA